MEISTDRNQFYMIRSKTPSANTGNKALLKSFSDADLLRMAGGDYACGTNQKGDNVKVEGSNLGDTILANLKENSNQTNSEDFQVVKYNLDDVLAQMLLKRQMITE